MKKILEYIEYVSAVVSAISKGAKIAADSWPDYNPFAKNDVKKEQQSGQP